MEIAKVRIESTKAKKVYCRKITRGIVGAQIAVEYDDPVWDNLNKIAVFCADSLTLDVVDAGDLVTIPAEITAIACRTVKVGIYGVNTDGTLVVPTVWAELGRVTDAADPSGDESTDPALAVWAQILAKIGNLDDLNTEAKDTLVAAINESLTKGGAVDETVVQRLVEKYTGGYVSFAEVQTLTAEQKTQARANIGASGYNWRLIYDDSYNKHYFANYDELSSTLIDIETALEIPSATGTGNALYSFVLSVSQIASGNTAINYTSYAKMVAENGKLLLESGAIEGNRQYSFLYGTDRSIHHENARLTAAVVYLQAREKWSITIPNVSGRAFQCGADGTVSYNTIYSLDSTLTVAKVAPDAAAVGNALAGKLSADALPDAVNNALALAKASGEFDGKDGYTPVKGTDYYTETDKQEMVAAVLAAMPTWEGGSY